MAWVLQEAASDMELSGQDIYAGLVPVDRRGGKQDEAEEKSQSSGA